jgi:hypothetical protein
LGGRSYCQRLLTSLIVGGWYPRWNTRSVPVSQGLRFLQRLWVLSFSEAWPGDDAVFIDEFELPPRAEGERGGAPDYAVLWPDLVGLIELKTERASHRPDQISSYFALGRHHYPHCRVWITYLTPPGEYPLAVTDDWTRYRQVAWPDVAPLIRRTWPSAPDPDRLRRGGAEFRVASRDAVVVAAGKHRPGDDDGGCRHRLRAEALAIRRAPLLGTNGVPERGSRACCRGRPGPALRRDVTSREASFSPPTVD